MAENLNIQTTKAVIIGGSAGSLDVLLEMFPQINPKINYPILIVIHRKPSNESLLVDLLQSRTLLKVKEAEEKEALKPGIVYIAPADYHLLIETDKTISFDFSEKVNYSRPSIDVTFQSAAEVYKTQLACLLLSGSNADGVEGLKAVNHFGGMALVQDPETAIMPYMPQQAVQKLTHCTILPPNKIANYLNNFT
ncbi:chemotaxis protein CheB [Pedobacter sp. MW01-1-1]|uniref:chemotaxis protein CheB n=1 Tax=Pedobacter sp. MW01-1-1 TaxID=3383027 RepID=UPI003FED4BC3